MSNASTEFANEQEDYNEPEIPVSDQWIALADFRAKEAFAKVVWKANSVRERKVVRLVWFAVALVFRKEDLVTDVKGTPSAKCHSIATTTDSVGIIINSPKAWDVYRHGIVQADCFAEEAFVAFRLPRHNSAKIMETAKALGVSMVRALVCRMVLAVAPKERFCLKNVSKVTSGW